MKITDIEVHTICPPFCEWNSEALTRYQGPDFRCRTIYILHTDNGLEGLGEQSGKPWPQSEEYIDQLRGSDPFDWLHHPTLNIGLAPAIYDLIGKHNAVPAYKLFGPKVRSWVPMGFWTVSQTPSKMAEEVEHAAREGYTWLKYHTSHFHNVIEQTKAMQEVAPPGFKIHYDLNFDNTVDHVLQLAYELAKYPIAGAIEDPLRTHHSEGYRLLREKSPLPIYFHQVPIGVREAILGLVDGYMVGHSPIGPVISQAGLFEAANVPFMTQNTGGNIMRAISTHIGAAFPMATLHHANLCHLWSEDVVTPTFKVSGGAVQVPESPGLGVTLDREALERWEAAEPDPLPRALIRIQYASFPTIYARLPVIGMTDHLGTGPSYLPGYGPSYNRPVDMDYWDDDGSPEFAELWERTASRPAEAK